MALLNCRLIRTWSALILISLTPLSTPSVNAADIGIDT